MDLEGPDDPLSLARAAELSGLGRARVRQLARRGRLQVRRSGQELTTTRRWLHDYLMSRDKTRRQAAPLPPGYVVPGEEA